MDHVVFRVISINSANLAIGLRQTLCKKIDVLLCPKMGPLERIRKSTIQ